MILQMNIDDWAAPRQPEEWVSYWPAFHDAEIISMTSDRYERTIEISLRLGFPKPRIDYSEIVTLHIENVTSLLIYASRNWPSPTPIGILTEPEVIALHAKSRVETISVTELQALILSTEEGYVMDGFFAEDGENAWLMLQVTNVGEIACWQIQALGSTIQVRSESGFPGSMGQLLALGVSGWNRWDTSANQD